jgi:hypothetical protein
MKKILKIFGVFVILFILILIGLEVQTIRMNSSHNAELFAAGTLPDPTPNGFFKGSANFYTGSWQGKTFDFENHRGINNFITKETSSSKYSFETNVDKDFADPNLMVYTLDYATSSNPFFIRPLLDEIVQIAPNQFLGKMQYRFIGGHPFTLGFFRLGEESTPTTIRNIPVKGKYFLIQLPQDWKTKFSISKEPQLSELIANTKDYTETSELNTENVQSISLKSGAKFIFLTEQGPKKASESISSKILESEALSIAGITTTLYHISENTVKTGELYETRFVYENNSYIIRYMFNKDNFQNGKQFLLDTLKSFSFPKNTN